MGEPIDPCEPWPTGPCQHPIVKCHLIHCVGGRDRHTHSMHSANQNQAERKTPVLCSLSPSITNTTCSLPPHHAPLPHHAGSYNSSARSYNSSAVSTHTPTILLQFQLTEYGVKGHIQLDKSMTATLNKTPVLPEQKVLISGCKNDWWTLKVSINFFTPISHFLSHTHSLQATTSHSNTLFKHLRSPSLSTTYPQSKVQAF